MFKDIFPDEQNRLVYMAVHVVPDKPSEPKKAASQKPKAKSKADPQDEGKRVMAAAAKWTDYSDPTKHKERELFKASPKKKAEVSPKEREILKDLKGDFPKLVELDKNNPKRFSIKSRYFYHHDIKRLSRNRTETRATFEIKGNQAHLVDNDYRSIIQGNISIHALSAVLQICNEATATEGKRRGASDKAYHTAMDDYGKEYAELMKHPTETFKEKIARKKKERERMRKQKIETVTLPKNIEFFRSASGAIIAYSSFGSQIYASKNGKLFDEMEQKGFGGTNTEHSLDFVHINTGKKSKLERKGNALTMGGETYKKVKPLKTIKVRRLPEIRQDEYSFRLKSGERLLVTASKHKYSYESFKLFIGKREIPIKSVDRLRDGGTTIIETGEGILNVPISGKPTWKGKPIK